VIPLKLTLRGFLTYRDEETLDFEHLSTAVIIGENGNGKSALFDAITYALFSKHRGSSTRSLVNQESRELAVRFEFLGPDGRRYRVDRSLTLSARKNGVPAPSATGSVFDGIEWQVESSGATGVTDWVQDVLGGMTYEICVQSILLRQGEHDRFLSAKPTERQLVLNTLLDLEPYRQLQKGAQGKKRDASSKAAALEGRLGDLVPHDPATLEQLQQSLAETEGQTQVAEHELAAARGRLDTTVRYWELDAKLKQVEADLRGKRALLDQSAQVREAARRRAALEQSIPLLGAAAQAQEAATEAEQSVAAARAELSRLDVEARRQKLDEAEARASEAEAAYAAARQHAEQLSAERMALTPKAELLQRADGERATAAARRKEAEPLAADAEADAETQAEAARLGERRAALPWLRQIAAAKLSLTGLDASIQHTAVDLETEKAGLPGAEQTVDAARQAATARANARREADMAVVQARSTADRLTLELEQRHEASDEQVCSHCGQPIDADHVANEIRLLDEQLKTATEVVTATEEALGKAEADDETGMSAHASAEADLRARQSRIATLDQELERAKHDREVAQATMATAVGQLTEAEAERVGVEPSYPTEDDLEHIQQEADRSEAARRRADVTRSAATSHAQLVRMAQGAEDEADRLESQVPAVERRQVRDRWAAIEPESREAQQARQQCEDAHLTTQAARTAAERALRADEQEVIRLETNIQVKSDLAASHRSSAATLLATVPDDVRPEQLSQDSIASLNSESVALKPLADRLDELSAAPEDAVRLDGQRTTFLGEIAEVPYEDRRDADLAEADRQLAAVALDERRRTQQIAKASLDRAAADAERAKGLEQHLLVAHTREEDARLLDNLLGAQQLQGKLVEAARVGITDAANRELDVISRGSLRLEMQRKVKRNGEEAELELMVLDRASVREPIDAAYLSGSQRFRVAVALALGIGQYVGGAARGQRAVIIDEGFGSLDADGVDAMAEHLRDLAGRLDRVILVTHQQAMKKHFDDGFLVQRKNGTSRVTPWSSADEDLDGLELAA
jgi:DNA repair exonuclease SbcCD ATPase subunit